MSTDAVSEKKGLLHELKDEFSIDLTEEDVIVEFGSNRNCRIPMQKAAIAQLEKASSTE